MLKHTFAKAFAKAFANSYTRILYEIGTLGFLFIITLFKKKDVIKNPTISNLFSITFSVLILKLHGAFGSRIFHLMKS